MIGKGRDHPHEPVQLPTARTSGGKRWQMAQSRRREWMTREKLRRDLGTRYALFVTCLTVSAAVSREHSCDLRYIGTYMDELKTGAPAAVRDPSSCPAYAPLHTVWPSYAPQFFVLLSAGLLRSPDDRPTSRRNRSMLAAFLQVVVPPRWVCLIFFVLIFSTHFCCFFSPAVPICWIHANDQFLPPQSKWVAPLMHYL